MQQDNGEVWSALGKRHTASALCDASELLLTWLVYPGHCYLMQDDLQKAYAAYQQALYLLPNPKVSFPASSSSPPQATC